MQNVKISENKKQMRKNIKQFGNKWNAPKLMEGIPFAFLLFLAMWSWKQEKKKEQEKKPEMYYR